MRFDIIELSASDPMPEVSNAGGVAPLPDGDRVLHAPDRHLLALNGGMLVARCSCWWGGTAAVDGEPIGVIGHYAASDAAAGVHVLSHACARMADAGRGLAVGPMDGNTWRRYRFVVERGPEPPFLLEPDNPDEWPRQWSDAGFAPVATYTSALNDDLSRDDARTPAALERLRDAGITIRAFDPGRAEADLRRLYALSLVSFSRNFLYTPIGEAEFLAQNRAVLPFVKPELMLVAERGDSLAGFIFGIPDVLQGRRGAAIDTVILKTIAVDPSIGGMGLGGALIDLVQREARQLGFRRAIHALMHETNVSRTMSDRYARTIRRYALFSRRTRRG
jgi:GNAT superfamily N-acetyltransferase